MSNDNTSHIDIHNADRAEILVALYNRARPQGMGFMHHIPEPMDIDDARNLITDAQRAGKRIYFDYLNGRVMKVDLSSSPLYVRLYDRDNGRGAAASALRDVAGVEVPDKAYVGNRYDSENVVSVNGEKLLPRNQIVNHSPDGFEWGYGGSGPAQLALAIMVDYLGAERGSDPRNYQQFKWDFIAPLKDDSWVILSTDIDKWLKGRE